MTRKDYTVLASSLADSRPNKDTWNPASTAPQTPEAIQWENTLILMMFNLSNKYPNFDMCKFREAAYDGATHVSRLSEQ